MPEPEPLALGESSLVKVPCRTRGAGLLLLVLESAEIGDWVREFLPEEAMPRDLGLPPPELTLRGLPMELPAVFILRGDMFGLVVLPSFLAIALPRVCQSTHPCLCPSNIRQRKDTS